ncbi:hypothetical protein [Conexibacter sp. DBS9H8]|uniref:hypothetical protein n=1 Tax=Conexibacter sp. DBS9H8 TaxID=2937801 RepID=UPI0020104404|nr:hypothetical protein [Conexibacter sp. DBS9H8]
MSLEQTTTVVLADEPTRAVLAAALWGRITDACDDASCGQHAAPGEVFDALAGCDEAQRAAVEPGARIRAERVAASLAALDLIAGAPVGATVTLPMAGEELAHCTESVRQAAESRVEAEGFLDLPGDRRGAILGLYDAAVALLGDLPALPAERGSDQFAQARGRWATAVTR